MRLLFVKERLAWPRSSGHDIHTYYSMQAIAQLGHSVGIVTLHNLNARAIEGSGVEQTWCLNTDPEVLNTNGQYDLLFSKAQEKFRSYWGVDKNYIGRVGEIAKEFHADAVVVVGLNVLPYLASVQGALRIWYAGDEWAWHHASQVRILQPGTWGELKQALIKGLYERAYASLLDRVWMVSNADKKAIHWVAGVKNVDVMPNGVDTQYYQPLEVDELPRSCVFWGRLDFGPNIQALQWFCKNVWRQIRITCGDARFSVFGFQPTRVVEELVNSHPGIELIPDQPDIREAISRRQVVVLPFTSGGGIKNKLLEAAALGKAIVCTPWTVNELAAGQSVIQAKTARECISSLISLWDNTAQRKQLGQAARTWVMKEHTWQAVANKAIQGIEASFAARVAG